MIGGDAVISMPSIKSVSYPPLPIAIDDTIANVIKFVAKSDEIGH